MWGDGWVIHIPVWSVGRDPRAAGAHPPPVPGQPGALQQPGGAGANLGAPNTALLNAQHAQRQRALADAAKREAAGKWPAASAPAPSQGLPQQAAAAAAAGQPPPTKARKEGGRR